MNSKTIGILGGGQLGLMMVEAAARLGIKTAVLDAENCPASRIATKHVVGSFKAAEGVRALAKEADVLTIEIEHINVSILEDLQKENPDMVIIPAPETIKLIQDKYLQKAYLEKHEIAVAKMEAVENSDEGVKQTAALLGLPLLLKARTNAYDGRGNYVLKSLEDIPAARKALGEETPLYAEKFVPFVKELAVMVVRTQTGEVFAYPVVETIHKDNICHTVYAPARVSHSERFAARAEAVRAVSALPGKAGIFGVEMFILADGSILVNEIAPRPHNSGHYTLNACVTSQFEAIVRVCVGLPLAPGFAELATADTNSIMVNVLGDKVFNGELEACKRALETAGANVYLYGKESKPKRKVGHINIVGSLMNDVEDKLEFIQLGTKYETSEKEPKKPLVGVIMGSDLDLPVMTDACNILKKFGVPFEVDIVLAHRTPHKMSLYATQAAERGIKVIIAGAGGAAHLPGMVAAMTPLPVIGVPVKGSRLDGVDSLYLIVQMPRGIPVATVAINNSTNAGLLAVRILGIFDGEYMRKMKAYSLEMESMVSEKSEKLREVGYEKY